MTMYESILFEKIRPVCRAGFVRLFELLKQSLGGCLVASLLGNFELSVKAEPIDKLFAGLSY